MTYSAVNFQITGEDMNCDRSLCCFDIENQQIISLIGNAGAVRLMECKSSMEFLSTKKKFPAQWPSCPVHSFLYSLSSPYPFFLFSFLTTFLSFIVFSAVFNLILARLYSLLFFSQIITRRTSLNTYPRSSPVQRLIMRKR